MGWDNDQLQRKVQVLLGVSDGLCKPYREER